MSGQHWLVVGEFDADPFEIEHPDGCPQSVRYEGSHGHPDLYDYDCAVGVMLADAGIDMYFQHADDPDEGDPQSDRVAAGRHAIEEWIEIHPGGPWGATEYSAGIRLADVQDVAS